jgi:signal transduction histidine kinase
LEIRICDTGPGVNPADMDYLFDPFFTRSPNGSGLGLSITHTIIEEHGGKIMVDSKLGRGACFKIFFSLNDGEADDAEDSSGG